MIEKSIFLIDTNNNRKRYYIIDVIYHGDNMYDIINNSNKDAYLYVVNVSYGIIGKKPKKCIQKFTSQSKELVMDYSYKLSLEKQRKGYKINKFNPVYMQNASEAIIQEISEHNIKSVNNMVIIKNDIL